MSTRTIRLEDDVYERVKAHKREDETFSEAIDRLIGERSFTELAGLLTDEEAAEYRRVIEEANEASEPKLDDVVGRF